MKTLAYVLAASVCGLALMASASASQDVPGVASHADSAGLVNMVETSYVSPAQGHSVQASLNAPVSESVKSASEEASIANELPNNGVLALLAGLAIIVVIGKRRMSS